MTGLPGVTGVRRVEAILDPTGAAAVVSGAGPLAPRPGDLRGLRIGLLENTKHNADRLLLELGRLLAHRYGAVPQPVRTKVVFALPLPDAQLAELRATCDVVVTGVGDCGSCSASAVLDGLRCEAAGLPAVVICSDAFTVTADTMAAAQGAPGYRYLTTPHPLAVLDAAGLASRAQLLLPQVVAVLTGVTP